MFENVFAQIKNARPLPDLCPGASEECLQHLFLRAIDDVSLPVGRPLKVYLAGRITHGGWRSQLVEYATIGSIEDWEPTRFRKYPEVTCTGPFFVQCHGACHGEWESPRAVTEMCFRAIDDSDLILAWLEPGAYGTAVEIGRAVAKGKPVLCSGTSFDDLWFAAASSTMVKHGTDESWTPITFVQEVLEHLEERRQVGALLESPIERLFYEALPTPRRSVQGFEVRLQYVEGPYRLDFAFLHPGGRKVCVECDGHDYHERTKEQAQRDRSRDRYLVKHGWQVMRFTGSELHRDARGCVGEVLELLGMQAR